MQTMYVNTAGAVEGMTCLTIYRFALDAVALTVPSFATNLNGVLGVTSARRIRHA